MTNDPNRFGIEPTEELPDRIAHRRKIAGRLALDSPEYAADDPSRTVDRAASGYAPRDPAPAYHLALAEDRVQLKKIRSS
jgi:hypothetical protein